MFIKVVFSGFNYNINSDDTNVYDHRYQILSVKEIRDRHGIDVTSFRQILLEKKEKASKLTYFDKESYFLMLRENLVTISGSPPSTIDLERCTKGINYGIIKCKDLIKVLESIERIVTANNTLLRPLLVDLAQGDAQKIRLGKFWERLLRPPFGRIEKNSFRVIPLLLEPLAQAIQNGQ